MIKVINIKKHCRIDLYISKILLTQLQINTTTKTYQTIMMVKNIYADFYPKLIYFYMIYSTNKSFVIVLIVLDS